MRTLALRILGAFLVVVLVVIGALYVISEIQVTRHIDAPSETIPIPTDAASIQYGQHMAIAVAVCTDCHGPKLGGKVLVDDPNLGRIVPANLTGGSGGVGPILTDTDMVRAIRHGVDTKGHQIQSMPSTTQYNRFSDADLGAIIAYVRSVPPVDSSLPDTEIKWLGRVLLGVGQLPTYPASIDHFAPRPAPVPAAVTLEYGEYLAITAGCSRCHGPGYSGGKIAQAPPTMVPAANITPTGLSTWSEADFIKSMRTGTRPDGRVLNPYMPWPFFSQMTDDELRAIWLYLKSRPPRETYTH